MKKVKNHFLSIVIPAYRQEKTIARDLRRIRNVLEKIRYDYEIVVVADGKEDRTFDNAQKVASQKIKVVGYEKNHGKGYAIRYGMARTKGDVVAFIDAGMDLDPNGLSMLLEHFEWYDADIIVGSKRHSVSQVDYPWQRKILSFGYQLLVRLLFGLNIRDTQVGMKFFKRKVLEDVLPRLLVKQYAFDIEILAVARRLGFKRIFEAPIRLQWDQGRS
ncbi:glycosyltransferase, partial [Candidatus Gottesmanbacteria bacterium]|nr:glycosyltransferase [Candidatus Gottesmanbacteria bacterium]